MGLNTVEIRTSEYQPLQDYRLNGQSNMMPAY